MITEDYCSFEISKLLKEKGFDGWCDYFYDDPRRQELRTKDGEDKYWNGHLWDDEYAAPTHQMAMKWLRERYDLHIEVIYNLYYKEYKGCMYKNIGEYNYTEFYSTYEEAVEAALKYVLENLI